MVWGSTPLFSAYYKGNKMIRIIKEGKIPLNEKKMVCNYCQTEFAYDFNEVNDFKRYDSRDGIYFTGIVLCPICSNRCLSARFSDMDYYLRFKN